MTETGRCCPDIAVHCHDGQTFRDGKPYRYRHALEWRKPKVTVYTAATRRRLAVHLNRYPGVVIGVAVQAGTRVVSLLWARPGKIVEVQP